MKKIIAVLILTCLLSVIYAQNSAISGTVVEIEKRTPISYASVALLNPADSAIIRTELTGKNGAFSIAQLRPGKYLLKIFFYGYQDYVSEPIELGKESKDLGIIVLQTHAETLQTVQITSKKPVFEQRLGKTVMNVESHPSAAGDNVLELLRKMPGVVVDNSDNISLQGKSGVLILIDDKDPHLSGDDLINFLKSMPATMIDRVEVMKNPSARYDAAGTAGIINLVTKHVNTNGINGSVWAGADYHGGWGTNEGFNLTGRAGKWVLNGSYYYMYQNSKAGHDASLTSIINEEQIRQTTNELTDEIMSSSSKFGVHGANFAADCYIDSVNTVSFSYRGSFFNSDWRSDDHSRIYQNDQLVTAFGNQSKTLMNNGNHQFNLNYKHVFDTLGTALYVDATYSLDHSKMDVFRSQPFFSDNFQTPLYSIDRSSLSHPNRMHVATAKIDFEHPFNDQVSLECGVKSSFVRNENNNVNYLNDSLLKDQSNNFLYSESITAAYLQANFQVNKQTTIQSGLRAEYAHIVGNLLTTGEVHKQDYADVFPSLQIDYQLPKMNNLSFAFRSRISRPNYHSLNPMISIDDDYNRSTGNPYLAPEYTHSVSVDYSWHYLIFASAGYEFTRGSVEDMLYTDKLTNIKLSRPENIGKMHAMRLSLFANIPVGRWWLMMWNVNYLLGQQTFDYETQTTKSRVSNMQLFTMHTFTFCKHYSIELSCWWMPKQHTTFGDVRGLFFAWGGFKASLFKDKFTIRLGVQDIFNSSQWRTSSVYPDGTSSSMSWIQQRRGVKLDLTYRFGKNNIQVRQRKTSDNDEFDRMGGGSGNGQGGQGGGQTRP